nr:HD domain-containing phosphohydrolase [Mesotoga sp.]
MIKNHPDEGYKILKEIHFGLPVAEIVRQHHERVDGSGYPRGLKDGEIMLGARILAVADVVEAISSHRPCRPALGHEIALKEIKSGAGSYL